MLPQNHQTTLLDLVRWPNGSEQVFDDLSARQLLVITAGVQTVGKSAP
jgi:hypothetical protein